MQTTPVRTVKKHHYVLWIILVYFAVALTPIAVLLLQGLRPNYAQELMRPFDTALLNKNAINACSLGGNGYSFDRNPGYKAYYVLPASRSDAIEIITQIASNNGFSLTHASIENRGFLQGLDDAYLDNWYFDDTNRQNPYPELTDGPVRLTVAINHTDLAEISSLSCDTKNPAELPSGPELTVIAVGIQLPEVK